ncbi:hypothetical protein SD457_25795 [Coprobacillaceae bacterium CR2/5/TPMF4]|nr:hypothetical protein SD457_25795 [Coprobacillaceae bacterium CR2/5/TPMF4]
MNNPNQAAYTEKFKEVQTAYKTIMDERKKALLIEHMVIVKVQGITDNLVININIQMTKVLLMKWLVL